jgi:hypothetical protein
VLGGAKRNTTSGSAAIAAHALTPRATSSTAAVAIVRHRLAACDRALGAGRGRGGLALVIGAMPARRRARA